MSFNKPRNRDEMTGSRFKQRLNSAAGRSAAGGRGSWEEPGNDGNLAPDGREQTETESPVDVGSSRVRSRLINDEKKEGKKR